MIYSSSAIPLLAAAAAAAATIPAVKRTRRAAPSEGWNFIIKQLVNSKRRLFAETSQETHCYGGAHGIELTAQLPAAFTCSKSSERDTDITTCASTGGGC